MRPLCVWSFCLSATLIAAAQSEKPATMNEMPLVFEESFEEGDNRWEKTDPAPWKVAEDGGDQALMLTDSSDYSPPVRSPLSIARVKDLNVTDFVADFHARQTGREYGHRDLCFFFGYQDPAHFYYVHLATKADDHANSIFLVNGEPRVSIAKERTDGTKWDDAYHHIRIKRDTETGRIEVFMDDMEKPVMVAEDKTFLHGTIGVGSFDDVGNFDDITVWGKTPEAARE